MRHGRRLIGDFVFADAGSVHSVMTSAFQTHHAIMERDDQACGSAPEKESSVKILTSCVTAYSAAAWTKDVRKIERATSGHLLREHPALVTDRATSFGTRGSTVKYLSAPILSAGIRLVLSLGCRKRAKGGGRLGLDVKLCTTVPSAFTWRLSRDINSVEIRYVWLHGPHLETHRHHFTAGTRDNIHYPRFPPHLHPAVMGDEPISSCTT